MTSEILNEYMGAMKSKRNSAVSPAKPAWHAHNNARGKINDMIKMNFSYLNKDELSAQLYNADASKEHESMQNIKRRQKITKIEKTRISSALTRNSMYNQTPSLSVFR